MDKVDIAEKLVGSKMEDKGCFPKLTLKERIMAFLFCTVVGSPDLPSPFPPPLTDIQGYAFEILGALSSFGVVTGNPIKFAVLYSLGNVVTICG